ncbi:ABC transporter permease subunit [Rossellomorea marisflavi]|uniref:ABC transporter permease n=1 Tax=Rossellomorea marisflavi TaxID=189381 RepID=UPI0034596368
MFAIAKREFFQLFKGFKSIAIILMLLVPTYYFAKFSSMFESALELTPDEADMAHSAGLLVVMIVFGQLFVMGLSHDTMNREMHERTMRFLLTRTSRRSIVAGKFLGILAFWFACITVSHVIIAIFSHRFDAFTFFQLMGLIACQVAFTVFLSTVVPVPALTMFMSIIAGILLPILGYWLAYTSNPWFSWMKYVDPNYYLVREDYTFLLMYLDAFILLLLSYVFFRRRGC